MKAGAGGPRVTGENMTSVTNGSFILTIVDELGCIPDDYRIELPGDGTTQEVIWHLIEAGLLPALNTRHSFVCDYDVRDRAAPSQWIRLDHPLAEQGVTAEATLLVRENSTLLVREKMCID